MRLLNRLVRVLWVPVLWCAFPLSVLAAEGESRWGWIETAGRWFNLIVLFGVIYIFTREPIRNFLRGRREDIARDIAAARQAREEAERKLAEIEARQARLEEELAEIRREAEAEAARERERILAQAEAEAGKILAAAGREIDGLMLIKAAKMGVPLVASRSVPTSLAVEMARERITAGLDTDARHRLVDRFIISLGATGKKDS